MLARASVPQGEDWHFLLGYPGREQATQRVMEALPYCCLSWLLSGLGSSWLLANHIRGRKHYFRTWEQNRQKFREVNAQKFNLGIHYEGSNKEISVWFPRSLLKLVFSSGLGLQGEGTRGSDQVPVLTKQSEEHRVTRPERPHLAMPGSSEGRHLIW